MIPIEEECKTVSPFPTSPPRPRRSTSSRRYFAHRTTVLFGQSHSRSSTLYGNPSPTGSATPRKPIFGGKTIRSKVASTYTEYVDPIDPKHTKPPLPPPSPFLLVQALANGLPNLLPRHASSYRQAILPLTLQTVASLQRSAYKRARPNRISGNQARASVPWTYMMRKTDSKSYTLACLEKAFCFPRANFV